MAYVVRRPGGRWEVRESVSTERGPRARTLATFRRLTPEVVDRAVRAASRPTSPEEVEAAARRAGAATSPADEAARALAAEIARGHQPSRGLRRLLLDLLSDPPSHDPLGGGAAEWFGASDEERGETVRDLLRLTDRYPERQSRPLAFPPLH